MSSRDKKIEKVLWWLIGGTRGGKNRLRIIESLRDQPMNANQLSENLDLDYKTVRHHLEVLEENEIVTSVGDSYGKNYFLTERMEKNIESLKKIAKRADMGDRYERED